jgi:glyoxylase-like metal-dependent hydrolase (beta-lactamase superfamily II)
VQLGEFEVLSLSDGMFRLDGGAMFGVVPKTLWQQRAVPDERNRIALSIRPLLVRTPTHVILIDAGVGDRLGAKAREIYGLDRSDHLMRSLAGAGVQPEDVDIVLATHLHFDHAGGFTRQTGSSIGPAFPRARYVIRRGEWEDATHPHERNRASYVAEHFEPLLDAGAVDFIEQDGEVVPGVSVWRTGGHTMHHQIVRIESAGQIGYYAADLLPTTAHIDEAWIMGYDLYPMDTLAFKKRFLAKAIAAEYVIFFEHDPAVTAGIITIEQGRKRVHPL